MNQKRLLLIVVISGLIGCYFFFDLGQHLNFEALKSTRAAASQWVDEHFLMATLAYFTLYVLVSSLSLPGAALLTLFGGAVFGFWWGLILVSLSSTIGATLAMLSARYLLRDSVESRFGDGLAKINAGLEKDGPFYLFSLRMVPLIPFFMVNLLMGLTRIKVGTYAWVSQIGMLPGTAAYVYAGTQLGQLNSIRDAVSGGLLFAFALVGMLPWAAKWVLGLIKAQKRYAAYQKPKSFDRDLVVIGAGAGGLVSAYIANLLKAKVTLIEKGAMGGDCLNTGCIPSKALLSAGHAVKSARQAADMGVSFEPPAVDFAKVKAHVQRAITTIEPHDSVERYRNMGVDVIQGEASVIDPWTVEVNGQQLSTRRIIIASGGHPRRLPIEGMSLPHVYTSDDLWSIERLPKTLVLIGGGPIGCELAQAFALLGSEVTILDFADRLLSREEPEASEAVQNSLEADGVRVLCSTAVQHITQSAVHSDKGEHPAEAVIVAVGRVADASGMGLEALGLLDERGGIVVDEYLRSEMPNILAVGDVVGGPQFTHAASHMAWHAVVNALLGGLKSFKVDYSCLPMVSYTAPEVARVGLTEAEAREQGLDIDVTTKAMSTNDRAIADGVDQAGFIKIISPAGKDTILGVTIVDDKAGELLAEWSFAKRHGKGMNAIMATIHPYPTRGELGKMAAGDWKKAHAPMWATRLSEGYFNWLRG